jgi:hypothetical protein
MSRLKSGIGVACILVAGSFLLMFDFFFESAAYLWFLNGYIAFVNLHLLAFFLFQFFVQPCAEHVDWHAERKNSDGQRNVLGVNGVFGHRSDGDRHAIGTRPVVQVDDTRVGHGLDSDFGQRDAPIVWQKRPC